MKNAIFGEYPLDFSEKTIKIEFSTQVHGVLILSILFKEDYDYVYQTAC